MRLRILGVFAHPDDESFCAGGTFAKYASEGAEIKVISATAGDAGQIRDARIATRRTLGMVRRAELRRAGQQLGIRQVEIWNYQDGTLHTVDLEQLADDVEQAIRDFRPQIVITFGLDGGYGHPDHIAISQATTRAFERVVQNDDMRLYYAHFPQSHMLFSERLVRWLVSLDKRFTGTLDFVHALMLLAEETTMLNYTNDYIEVKWFPPGFYMIEQGEPSTKLYFILSGQAQVIREHENGQQQLLDTIGTGRFFGEDGLATRKARNAHVVATESVTCLVFSPTEPTHFEGRGSEAQVFGGHTFLNSRENSATTQIDVTGYITQKMNAIAQHRSQFPLDPQMFPQEMLQDIFGQEYFVQVMPLAYAL